MKYSSLIFYLNYMKILLYLWVFWVSNGAFFSISLGVIPLVLVLSWYRLLAQNGFCIDSYWIRINLDLKSRVSDQITWFHTESGWISSIFGSLGFAVRPLIRKTAKKIPFRIIWYFLHSKRRIAHSLVRSRTAWLFANHNDVINDVRERSMHRSARELG